MTDASVVEEKPTEQPHVPQILPILPSGDTVIYPFMMFPIVVTEEHRAKLVDEAAVGDKIIGLFAQAKATDRPSFDDLYRVGTAALIVRMLKVPDGTIHALLQGIARVGLIEPTQTEPFIKSRVEVLQESMPEDAELQALTRNAQTLFEKVVSLTPNEPPELAEAAGSMTQPSKLADFIAANTNLKTPERQELLQTLDVGERFRKLASFLNRELEILEIGSKIQSQVKDEMTKAQRDYYLREQLKAIQKELGETDPRGAEIEQLREKVEKAELPPEALKEARREMDRLQALSPASAEYGVITTYLDWMANLPWSKGTVDNLDINQAEQVLNEDHYDLEKVKERILDYLAVRKLKEDMKGPILCFVGPPGVGKTSLGQSIARALGRKFVRMSLGGVRDEAEIRGHRRTYVGALPGRIVQAIRRVESNNPLVMLDEVDKLGRDFRGDPAAALLEVLDPQQNSTFVDHYLDVAFDLSKAMFITTANLLDPIPPALLDRMEVIELPGYSERDKLQIARKFLVPRQLAENGISEGQLHISDDALLAIISSYTKEAGVRNLEREIGNICRKTARAITQRGQDSAEITERNLESYLGQPRFRYESAEQNDEIGLATGVAVTPVGGDILFVEATLVPGHSGLILTGHLGEVMQESARAAVTYARSRAAALGVPEDFHERLDIHIHVPAGAIPKDGPSAGVTMATALVSAMTMRPVAREVAMTGEITLRGKVFPVGGIKDKVLAAHRAGIKVMILPTDNEKDLADVPAAVKEDMRFVLATSVDDVLDVALRAKPQHAEEALAVAAGDNISNSGLP
ncbi:MAG: endopeptidase La [Chloroflexi bacterium]|nr:endopeptidase La [Chloroflexota bacterium]